MFSQLAGLEEKCRIYRNDEVAEALRTRAEELSSHPNQWVPEMISLLLGLSGDPLVLSVEDLDDLKQATSPAPLTWTDILRDDPLKTDDGIWDTIDYGEDSLDDGDDFSIAESLSRANSLSAPSGPSNQHARYVPYTESIIPDYDLLDEIIQFQSSSEVIHHNTSEAREPVLETQLIKEVLFMLHGLRTRFFAESETSSINLKTSFHMQDVSQETVKHALSKLTGIGERLCAIRKFASSYQQVPLLQTFQASLSTRLEAVSLALSSVEARILDTSSPSMTLLGTLSKVQEITCFMLPLADILTSRVADKDTKHFEVLEMLYDKVCISQSIGDKSYEYLADVFFESLQTFMKPIRRWMEFGELDSNDKVFFVGKKNVDFTKDSLWSEQFELLKNEDGGLYAPKFLHLSAKRILTSGKSINMLRALGHDLLSTYENNEIELTFSSVCESAEGDRLSPFPELFGEMFATWIASKYQLSSHRLREALISHCGLWTSLDALEFVYFARNGSLQAQVARSILSKIDRVKRWDDKWTLSSLLQEIFGRVDSIDSDRLVVDILQNSISYQNPRSIQRLEIIRVHYSLPWAVGTIVKSSSFSTYQSIFVMLLQIQRAKILLDSQTMDKFHTRSTHMLVLYLRHRLRWYVEILHSHLTTTISDSTRIMRRNLEEAEDLDAMIAVHESYIQKLTYSCLLTKEQSSSRQAVISLLDLVVVFHDACHSIMRTTLARNSTAPKTQHEELEASSSEEDEEVASPGIEGSEGNEDALFEKLSVLSSTYSRLLDFVLAGVRDASRIGDAYLDILVDNLSFGVR